ncbi:PREDICTED: mitochondrial arginine transporter BAC1-like [Priapulus caudatus]|uniref:Mitochondrial arginine transporter BAC1-like n=1 Tax=Priapulus caudatus TaxID=37621 RepID=A0ABM1EMV1_PRICU|nr:PREDICTED: mitochondrial arginine transporter BAC1-like [Priapulus caudatus]
MTHNELRSHWLKEGAIGLGVGVLYGVTNVAVGHPFDTVKTKMQAQRGFESGNMLQTFGKTLRHQGIIGLYRGCIPPLWGSGIYRSAQFAVFEAW